MKLTPVFKEFFNTEKAGGLVLVFVTLISLYLANSDGQNTYKSLWIADIGGHELTYWINEGLMAIFFLFIGLELEREIYSGELSNIRNATLPIFGALGGMLVPACIYFVFNFNGVAKSGAGIPMATDIAFAIGILSLLGKRVPASLKVFLTALAVIDDLGAIVVIAIFYTSTLAFLNLLFAVGIFIILLVLNRLKIHNLIYYLIGGIAMWYFMSKSGVHATITGVLLAFALPFGDGKSKSASYILQKYLQKPVAFFILPLFAMANTCITLGGNWTGVLGTMSSMGIFFGLVIGKPTGIWLFSYIASKMGFCELPADLKWKHIFGAGILGGIGFTMSIFITLLAFDDAMNIANSKIAILAASTFAGIVGYLFLRFTFRLRLR